MPCVFSIHNRTSSSSASQYPGFDCGEFRQALHIVASFHWCFALLQAVFLLVNFAFAMISMMLVASADGVTWDDIFGATSSALDVNCTDIGLNYNSSNYTLDVENATASIENLAAEFDALTSWLQAEASSLT